MVLWEYRMVTIGMYAGSFGMPLPSWQLSGGEDGNRGRKVLYNGRQLIASSSYDLIACSLQHGMDVIKYPALLPRCRNARYQ